MFHVKKYLQKIKRFGYITIYNINVKKLKVDDNKILFLSDSREKLSGNFEFIYNYLKDNYKYNLVCHLKKNLKTKRNLKEKMLLINDISTAKYILVDDFYPLIYPLKIREGVKLIQVWHAMGAFKTVGYSRNKSKNGYSNANSLTHKNYTDTIVSSESIVDNYAEAFGISRDKVHAYGIPRTDIFFDNKYKKDVKNRLYKKYPQFKNKKVILFAPTFRGAGQKTAYYDYGLLDFDKIKKELGHDYIFILKIHPFVLEKPVIDSKNKDFYYDLSSEREINDLLFITDILITDYSSVIFEYSFFKKPVIFFVPDYDDYDGSRGFYYKFEKYTYGDVVKNNDELIKSIKNGRVDSKKLEEFYDFFCSGCDGKSTKRFVDKFIVGDKK